MWNSGRLTGCAIFIYYISMLLVSSNPSTPYNLTIIWVCVLLTLLLDLVLADKSVLREKIPAEIFLLVIVNLYFSISSIWLPDENRWLIEQLQLLIATIAVTMYTTATGKILPIELASSFGLLVVFLYLLSEGRAFDYDQQIRETATVGNANSYAFFLLVGLLISLRRLFLQQLKTPISYAIALFNIVIVVMCAVQIVLATGSRKGVVGLTIILAIYFYYGLTRLRNWVRFSAIITAIMIIAVLMRELKSTPQYERIITIFTKSTSYSLESSYQTREYMKEAAYNLWIERPLFGWGTDQFRYIGGFYRYSHSNIYEILINNGLIGFILYNTIYCIMIARLLYYYRFRIDSSQNLKTSNEFVFALSGLLVVLSWNVAAVTYVDKIVWIFTALMIGILVYKKRNMNETGIMES
jgi:O-antigen ligase